VVARRGHRDADEVHAAQERARISVRRAAVLGRDVPGARRIRVGHADQLDVLERRELLGMELAEVANTDDRGTQLLHACILVSRTALRPAAAS
jgi:hypothetical protein